MREIPVSGGKYVAFVDDEDYERVIQHKWWFCRGYAYTQRYGNRKKHTIRLHRFIVSATPGQEVDHKNAQRLDCRKENLRICTNPQNHWNYPPFKNKASAYKGVSRMSSNKLNPWYAAVQANGTRHYLGCFPTQESAALAYDEMARELHGEFARLNF
jgi:hypothetical protein